MALGRPFQQNAPMPSEYRNNHYVPVWYQTQFIPPGRSSAELYYLDRNPDTIRIPGRPSFKAKALRRGGPKHHFCERDLYTLSPEGNALTSIEKEFFGEIDGIGSRAVKALASFKHNAGFGKHFQNFVAFLSAQKLRTPKGLGWLATQTRGFPRDEVLKWMAEYHRIFCSIWTESVWQIADAGRSATKFIFSDHPVTIYNKTFGPNSDACKGFNDPDIRQHASHTLFPLSPEKVLILTNLSWVRNPYQNGRAFRPNPNFFRDAVFHLLEIQIERFLEEIEVRQINFIIKSRSLRFVAGGEEEWLFPERYVSKSDWARFGLGYLLMPDPRCVPRSSGVLFGFKGGGSTGYDEYGRRPGDPGYKPDAKRDWSKFNQFQGEYARLFGPRRRGRTFELGHLSPEEDSDFMHQAYLRQEERPRPQE